MDTGVLLAWKAAHDAARRLRAKPEDADDVAQVVALRFLERSVQIRDPASWGAVVGRRELAYRARALARFAPEDPSAASERTSFEAEVILSADLSSALSRASVEDRRILEAGLAGSSHAEIAEGCGLAVSAVGAYLRRAADRLARSVAGRSRTAC